ncbi:hypothetical protein CEXT_160801 [Caerostris extrusa]|uniref:Uncharacterized protein n=1 Tax=Caerostris extrusa TaxID=172846 RepID=A0AAV4UZ04_CAEEX|nr:hypothetical protein CEXT_160801 [Caerostris extrusa]
MSGTAQSSMWFYSNTPFRRRFPNSVGWRIFTDIMKAVSKNKLRRWRNTSRAPTFNPSFLVISTTCSSVPTPLSGDCKSPCSHGFEQEKLSPGGCHKNYRRQNSQHSWSNFRVSTRGLSYKCSENPWVNAIISPPSPRLELLQTAGREDSSRMHSKE